MLYINALRREKIMRILGIDPGYAIVGWGVIDYENRLRLGADEGRHRHGRAA